MALKALQAMGREQITALADRGYCNGDQVLSCEGTGVAPVVPKTLTSGHTKRGLFTGQDFIYDAKKDHYTCPAGQHLTKGRVRSDPLGRSGSDRLALAVPDRPSTEVSPLRLTTRYVGRPVETFSHALGHEE